MLCSDEIFWGKMPLVVMKFVGAKYGNKNVKIILVEKCPYVVMKIVGGKSEQRTYPQGISLLIYIRHSRDRIFPKSKLKLKIFDFRIYIYTKIKDFSRFSRPKLGIFYLLTAKIQHLINLGYSCLKSKFYLQVTYYSSSKKVHCFASTNHLSAKFLRNFLE